MSSHRTLPRALGLIVALLSLAFAGTPAHAAWMWDQNQDKIDDRMAEVESLGANAARVGGVSTGRLRFALLNAVAPFEYGVYVGYDHHPTDADAAALAALGVPVQVRYHSIDYIRTRVTYAQALQIAALPGVRQIETIPIMYPVNDVAARTLRARESDALFPSVWQDLGVTGKGIVVAILDTGVNDAPMGAYPGHESLRGKWLGGGEFYAGDPLLNTPLTSSINPSHADPEGTYHGTHVAGTAIGTGGPEGIRNGAEPGFNAGIAPDARLVDCKALSDAGLGFGSADALDWLVYNKNNTWGLTGADSIYWGVDVANLSLGSDAASDGKDANSAAVNAAHKAGIVVLVASGNDGNTAYMPSPAAADLALTIGSFADDNTVRREDDYVSDFSNEGPRTSDGDADQLDEMKPNVMGSGTGITSALGDPSTDGAQYHHINGTSMACPSVAGVVALVRSANPTLSADQVRQLMMDTADHRTDRGKQAPGAADPFDVDSNYHPSWGWGQVDAYAAVKEALLAPTTQVVRIAATPQRGPDGIQIAWTSQREVGVARWKVDRAPDAGGRPGAWAEIHEQLVATPSTQIHRTANRHAYAHTDLDPTLDPAATYWYRLRWTDSGGASHNEPPIAARIADSPVVAQVRYSWTHDFSDGDLYVRFGTGTDTGNPAWFRQGLGAQSADSVVSMPGINFTGTKRHYFHVDLTAADLVGGFLPPSAANPWFLSVREGGYVNTKGFVNDFSVTVYTPAPTTYTAPNPITSTVERQETVFWVPVDPVTTPNHSPVLAPVGARAVAEGLPLSFTLSASDPDGQPVTYSATGLPTGATFDAGTRTFSWTPGYDVAGSYAVTFQVSDGAIPIPATDAEDVTITVTERNPGDNTAPSLATLTDRHGVAGQRMSYRVSAHDAEGGALTYAIDPLPAGATFDASTGVFDWVPVPAEVGYFPTTFTVTDPLGATDTGAMTMVVSAPASKSPTASTCDEETFVQSGIVDAGIDPLSVAYSYQAFTVPPGTQSIEGVLTWFGGPSRDLDFTLLDADSNVVGGSGSLSNPEVINTASVAPGTYLWRVTAFTNPDTAHYDIRTTMCVSHLLAADGPRVTGLSFAGAAPNPFRTFTTFSFTMPSAAEASLRLYDVSGRLTRTLENGMVAPGAHVRVWDRRANDGSLVSPGVYFAQLETEGRVLHRKVVLVK
jgi:subtilisin family serine protease